MRQLTAPANFFDSLARIGIFPICKKQNSQARTTESRMNLLLLYACITKILLSLPAHVLLIC